MGALIALDGTIDVGSSFIFEDIVAMLDERDVIVVERRGFRRILVAQVDGNMREILATKLIPFAAPDCAVLEGHLSAGTLVQWVGFSWHGFDHRG